MRLRIYYLDIDAVRVTVYCGDPPPEEPEENEQEEVEESEDNSEPEDDQQKKQLKALKPEALSMTTSTRT